MHETSPWMYKRLDRTMGEVPSSPLSTTHIWPGLPMTYHANAPQHVCIPRLLEDHAKRIPQALALLAPGRVPLTYDRLYRHIHDTVHMLQARGLGRHDCIALVLPNGPEMAVAFLAVASCATCAPLNPAYSAQEFDFYLTALHAKALILLAGMDSPARAIAQARGIGILELSPTLDAEAGLFTLPSVAHVGSTTSHEWALPEDVALVLHTTGTTSQPKIAPLTHRNICIATHNVRVAFALVESDRCLNVLPLFHVHGLLMALLTSLVAGASIVCPPTFSAPDFFTWMDAFHPTWYTAVPTIHQTILTQAPEHQEVIARCPLRFIRSGSAVLSPHILTALESTFGAPVIDIYGMTETSGQVTGNPLPPQKRQLGSVGVSIGPEVAIMDEVGTLLPAGAVGEIVVRGPTVMQGYANAPVINQQAFTQGWFRSGDQGYMDTDGYLFVTGRLKEMINRGGTKITPQEVDDAFMAHPAVAQAVTFAIPHRHLGEAVATAVVLRPQYTATELELRQFVTSRLASFKVPSHIRITEALPVGPVGKVLRSSLAAQFSLMDLQPPPSAFHTASMAPQAPLEEELAELWKSVLNCERVGRYGNFFQLGGDSLLATQLLSRIREVAHVDVSFQHFFETPTVADIAKHIATVQQSEAPLRKSPRPSGPREGPLPLSYAQQRLWFLEQFGLSRQAYHILEALRLRGSLQVRALEQSLQDIVKRHEIFRTTFTHMSGQPFQVIGAIAHLPLSIVDLQELPHSGQEAQVHRLAQADIQQPFDLAQGPLLRATLLRLSDMDHVLLFIMHHMVSDGWSHGVFWRELAVLYEAYTTGKPALLPALPMQYADFAHWQRQWLQKEVLDPHLAYWKQQLTGVSLLQLSTDFPRPALQTFRGARHSVTLPPTLAQALKTLSQQHSVTLFMTLLAAFQTLLHRYTGQDDITVGSLIANRNRAELEGLIGFFVNTLVLRTDLAGDPSFQELLVRVRDVTLGAYEHQDLPYEKLLEELRLPRDLSRNPLFQVMCVLHNTPQQAVKLPGLHASRLEIDPGTARFDLALDVWETPEGGLYCRFEYSTDLFQSTTIARLAGHLHTLLESVVAKPAQHLSRLPLLPPDERQHLLVEWNATSMPYTDDQCLQRVFETQVTRTPDAVAVVCGEASLTYRELNRRANQVASYLQALNVGPEVLVGLCTERSLAMVVGLLGILKAGAAYLPLDPTYPFERLAYMLEDAQSPVILTQAQLIPGLPACGAQMICLDVHWHAIAQHSDHNPSSAATADSAAYLLYTSGSTGQPKGVLGTHRATLNVLTWLWHTYPFASHDVCCQKIPLSFTDSVQELLGPLLQGMPTVLIPEAVLQDLPRFVRMLATHSVTRVILVPSLLRALLETYSDLQQQLPSLGLWFTGGEALSSDLWQRFRERLPHSRLVNLYGASEVSANTTWYDTSLAPAPLTSVPIGRPIANTQVYVLDVSLQPVPIGVPGELYVGGASLTRGYLNRPALTAERFLPHPFSAEPGARLYKTGDLVRYRSDGQLEYLGRLDQQVKLRGIRIELGEIEASLTQHPDVREAVVSLREDTPGEPRLVAYVVPVQKLGPSARELRRWLAKQLLPAMVPAAFVMLAGLPLTPSGKVDRLALPEVDPSSAAGTESYVAPRTSSEQQIASIWCHLLHLERVGIYDNFFELGGHSLLAIQLLARVRDAVHLEVSLLRFFEEPTVAGMAASTTTAAPDEQLPALRPISREQALPAAIAQEPFWLFDQMLPGLPLFNIPCVVRLVGPLDVVLLKRSLAEIISRHEALRTTFTSVDGQLLQIIAPTMRMPLTVYDLRVLPESEREERAQQLIQDESQGPFDLTQGPLLRGCLLRLGEQEHRLLITLHHIISDGWSLGVLLNELTTLYDAFATGQASPLPALSIQYADFASWQRQALSHTTMTAQLAYWRERLREPVPALALPLDRPRQTAFHVQAARRHFTLPTALHAGLTPLSQQEGSTLFMTCLAALSVLLHGYTGQKDFYVATLVANRTRQETESLIGLLVNTVLLRMNLQGNPTCREVLQRVRATTLAASAHQDLPFEELLRTLEREGRRQRASLCQMMVVWQNAMLWPLLMSTSTLTFETLEQSVVMPDVALTTFDIILTLRERPQGITGTCLYKTDLFDAATIDQMLSDFQQVLVAFSARPEQELAAFGAVHRQPR